MAQNALRAAFISEAQKNPATVELKRRQVFRLTQDIWTLHYKADGYTADDSGSPQLCSCCFPCLFLRAPSRGDVKFRGVITTKEKEVLKHGLQNTPIGVIFEELLILVPIYL